MKCNKPGIEPPVDFEAEEEDLNIMISALGDKVWVCINGVSVFRVRGIKNLTIDDQRLVFDEETPSNPQG